MSFKKALFKGNSGERFLCLFRPFSILLYQAFVKGVLSFSRTCLRDSYPFEFLFHLFPFKAVFQAIFVIIKGSSYSIDFLQPP